MPVRCSPKAFDLTAIFHFLCFTFDLSIYLNTMERAGGVVYDAV